MAFHPETATQPAIVRPLPAIRGSGLNWLAALTQALRFHRNKLLYRVLSPFVGETLLLPDSPLVKEARVFPREGYGRLPYWVTRDEHGILRGGQPAWTYLQDLAVSANNRTKLTITCQLLAQLPSDVSFHFVFRPGLPDEGLMREAFYAAGFTAMDIETYVCAPRPGHTDVIDALTGRSIKGTLRRAKRDLELVEMSSDEFFSFQQVNLASSGRKDYRDTNADRAMLEDCLRHGNGRVLAARRWKSANNLAPFPAAAMACLWDGEDGIYKLWRLTNNNRADGASHVDATKLLVLAAMQDATARNLLLETDGSTPGLANLYALFGPGIFERTTRLQCVRNTIRAQIDQYYPSLHSRLNALIHKPVRLIAGSRANVIERARTV